MTTARPFTTTRPPPIESLGKIYFTPLLAVPVVTRQPQPAPNQVVPPQYLRMQSGGGAQRPDGYLWDISLILHSYAPNEEEVQAEDTLGIALGWGANAQGTTITLRNGTPWYVTFSHASAVGKRLHDPLVDAIRYRGVVTWRVAGRPL